MRQHATLVLPDVHCPFHNRKLLKKICQLAYDTRPEQLVISGDFGDYYSVSRHNAGSLAKLSQLTLGGEYAEQSALLDDIGRAARKCRKSFLFGNHEDSARRWLESEDNAKVAGAFALPTEALRLRERGFEVLDNWKDDSVAIGEHLQVIHGEYCTTHSAKKHLDEWESSVMFGHTHRWQAHVTGKRGAYNIGWLGDKNHPAFNYATASQKRKWCNGFAMVFTLDDGSFLPCPVQVWESKFVWAGKLY